MKQQKNYSLKELNCVLVGNVGSDVSIKLSFPSFPPLKQLKQILACKVDKNILNDMAFIVGNKVYNFDNSNLNIFSNSKTMFIIPKALP